MRRRSLLVLPALIATSRPARAARAPGRWPAERAHAWMKRRGYRVGCNFIPSTASNQLEMWQAETFDAATIDRELGWARGLGFTSVRVFLHDIPHRTDPAGFFRRVDTFLGLAAKHHIGVLFVLFDGVWDPVPVAGPQTPPRPGVHNARWVQSPGAALLGAAERHGELEGYVTAVLERYRTDARVDGWDLFNEPDNPNTSSYKSTELPDKAERARALLEKTFRWARAVNPQQPLTAAPWDGVYWDPAQRKPIDGFMLENVDVVSFHAYTKVEDLRTTVAELQATGRPLLCTEYLARGVGSTFEGTLAYLRAQNVGAYNWGLVAGRTQTIYPWDTWKTPATREPAVWHHDILRADGTPFDAREVAMLKRLLAPARAKTSR